jgi:hypothetical protein
MIGLAIASPLDAGQAAETQTSFGVSVIVANACSVRLTMRPGVNSHCAWPQPATVSAVPPEVTPTTSRGEAQGVRYLAIEY